MDQKNFAKKIEYSRIFSASKIKLFEQCPKSFWFNYVDPISYGMKRELRKLPENIFPFQTLGKSVHDALTLFYHSPVEERNLEGLKEKLKLTWKSEVYPYSKMPLGEQGGFQTIEEEREFYRKALAMLTNLLKMPFVGNDFEFLPTSDFKKSIEDYHNLITPMTEDFDISGKFDMVVKNSDGSLNVIDFKTGKEEIQEFQMYFYKLLAEEKFQKPVKGLFLYFLQTGRVIQIDSGKEKEEIRKEIVEKVENLRQAKDYETKPSKLCKFCLFKNFCPQKNEVGQLAKDVRTEEIVDDLPF